MPHAKWFEDLPASARWALILGGGAIYGFSSALPQGLQTAGLFLGIVAVVYGVLASIWHWIKRLRNRVGSLQTALLLSTLGAWLCITIAIGTGAWAVLKSGGIAPAIGAQQAPHPQGPLSWMVSPVVERRNDNGYVVSLSFKGANISNDVIEIKSANLISGMTGTTVPFKIVADAGKDNEEVELNQIEPIPPGARIELKARFNPPNGEAPNDFLATWGKLSLNVVDSKNNTYRLNFDETVMMVFFEGRIGPRVTKKKG